MRSEESAVCLVDDDPLVLNSLRHLLASDGIATRSFDRAEALLAHIKMHSVVLVVLDIWMERVTGLDVLARLCVGSPQTRVIVITARDDLAAPPPQCKAARWPFLLSRLATKNFSPLSTTRLLKQKIREDPTRG